MAELKEITVPDIGDFDTVEVIEVLVAPGDTVNAEDSLITVESDKASMEIPSPESGVVKEVKVKVGDKISQGSVMVLIEPAGKTAPAKPEETAPAEKTSEKPQETQPATPAPRKQEAASSAPTASAASEDKQVRVPDIGDFGAIPVIEVLVSPGDRVNPEDPLITLESDKATMEIPSPEAGTVKELLVKVGDKVSKETPILVMTTAGATAAETQPAKTEPKTQPVTENQPSPAAPSAAQPGDGQRPAPLPPVSETGFSKAHASPAVRKFARELGADIGRIQGTGPKGRIQKEDVRAYIKQILSSGAAAAGTAGGLQVAELPEVDFSAFGEIETQPLSKINKLTGKYVHRSWVHIPHVTQFDEADITDLEAFRKQLSAEYKDKGVKVTIIAFLLKAAVAALREFPRFNSSLDNKGENLILKKYFHIGVAVDTPDGLVVPVIRDVDKKGVIELAVEVIDIAKRAREKKIKPSEMQGGCFTISSLGGVGGTAFTPIINQREVAILGVSRASMKPVYEDGQFVPRLMLPLSLSYDHRVIDGVMGAKFTNYLSQVLSDVKRLLL